MDIEFNPAKNAANQAKHGITLGFGIRVFDDDDHLVMSATRPIDGEDRYKAVGMVEGKIWTAVYADRNETIRMISVRRSNAGEERAYYRNSGGD